jgi:hypothetical protein
MNSSANVCCENIRKLRLRFPMLSLGRSSHTVDPLRLEEKVWSLTSATKCQRSMFLTNVHSSNINRMFPDTLLARCLRVTSATATDTNPTPTVVISMEIIVVNTGETNVHQSSSNIIVLLPSLRF